MNTLSYTVKINNLHFFLPSFMIIFLNLCVFLTSPMPRQGDATHGIFRSVLVLLSILSWGFLTLSYILNDAIDATL